MPLLEELGLFFFLFFLFLLVLLFLVQIQVGLRHLIHVDHRLPVVVFLVEGGSVGLGRLLV